MYSFKTRKFEESEEALRNRMRRLRRASSVGDLAQITHQVILSSVTRCWSKKLPKIILKLPQIVSTADFWKNIIIHSSPKMLLNIWAIFVKKLVHKYLKKSSNLVTLILSVTVSVLLTALKSLNFIIIAWSDRQQVLGYLLPNETRQCYLLYWCN